MLKMCTFYELRRILFVHQFGEGQLQSIGVVDFVQQSAGVKKHGGWKDISYNEIIPIKHRRIL